jgi:hypothetical protein
MIDTIRFKITTNHHVITQLQKYSTEHKGIDHSCNHITYQIFRSNVKLGSFCYAINLILSDYDYFFLELSIPKFIYGHNVLLFPPELLYDSLIKLRNDLCRFFNCYQLPCIKEWECMRIDFCYAWKFYDDLTAQRIIEYLKNQIYSRKKTACYGTSVMWIGSDYSLKFYMKGPEYFAHDFKHLRQTNLTLGYNLLDLSRGVVRFECTFRKHAIQHLFGTNILYSDLYNLLTRDNIITIMHDQLIKLLGVSPTTMSTQTAYDKILSSFHGIRATQIYSFYRMFCSSDPVDRSVLSSYSRATRYRYQVQLRRLHLAIPSDISSSCVSLSIPSSFCVGEFPPPSNTGGMFHR